MKTKGLGRAVTVMATVAAIGLIVTPLTTPAGETKISTARVLTAPIPSIERASSLIGTPIRNEVGLLFGKVTDVVLSEDGKTAEYIAFLPVGTPMAQLSAYAPYDKVKWAADRKALVCEITLEKAKALSKEMAMTPAWSRDASRLIGLSARDPKGLPLGSIRDLLIDKETRHVIAATVRTGGFLGIGSKFASVEWSAVRIEPAAHFATLSLTRDEFKQLVYSERKYWEQLGFSSPEEHMPEEEPDMWDLGW